MYHAESMTFTFSDIHSKSWEPAINIDTKDY